MFKPFIVHARLLNTLFNFLAQNICKSLVIWSLEGTAGEPFLLYVLSASMGYWPLSVSHDPRPSGCRVSPAVTILMFLSCIQVFGESDFVHKPPAEDKTTAIYEWTVVEGTALECLGGLCV